MATYPWSYLQAPLPEILWVLQEVLCFIVYGWVDMWDNQDILYGCKNRIMVVTCLCGAGGILHLCVRA